MEDKNLCKWTPIIAENSPSNTNGILFSKSDSLILYKPYETNIYEFHLSSQNWRIICPSSPERPNPSANATGVCNEKFLYIHERKNFYKFIFAQNKWEKIADWSGMLKSRVKETVTFKDDKNEKIIFFGGYGECVYRNDLIEYDDSDQTWKEIIPVGTELPQPRFLHTASKYGDNLYIFGGSDSKTIFNDIWVFNFTSQKWKCIYEKIDDPSLVYMHSLTGPYKDKVYIFGGFNGSMGNKNILMSFDLNYHFWRKVDCYGKFPGNRLGHSMTIQKGNLYLFGGKVDEDDEVFLKIFLGDENTEFKILKQLNKNTQFCDIIFEWN